MRNPMISSHYRSLLTASTVTLGTIALITGCGPQAKTNNHNAANNPGQPNATNASLAAAPANSNNLPVPGIPPIASSQMPTLPIAGLTPASDPKAVGAKAQAQPKQGDPFSSAESMSFTMAPAMITPKPNAKNALKSQGKAGNIATKPGTPQPNGPIARINPTPNAQRSRQPVRNLSIPTFPQPRTIAAVPVVQPIAPPRPPSVSAPVIAVPNVAMPQSAPVAVAPSAPQAEAIAITGVMQTNGRTMVIAQAPNSSARYVEAGDLIGQVRVKSIQVSRSGEPTVVLEQNGVTVTKSVGAR